MGYLRQRPYTHTLRRPVSSWSLCQGHTVFVSEEGLCVWEIRSKEREKERETEWGNAWASDSRCSLIWCEFQHVCVGVIKFMRQDTCPILYVGVNVCHCEWLSASGFEKPRKGKRKAGGRKAIKILSSIIPAMKFLDKMRSLHSYRTFTFLSLLLHVHYV